MTNTDTSCLTCGHDAPHISPAIDYDVRVDGDVCTEGGCSCRAYVPAPSTESEVLQKIRAGVPGYAPAPSTTPLCNCYTSGEGTIQCKMPNGVGCPYAALRNMPSTTDAVEESALLSIRRLNEMGT